MGPRIPGPWIQVARDSDTTWEDSERDWVTQAGQTWLPHLLLVVNMTTVTSVTKVIVRDEEVRSGQPEFLSLFLGPPKLFLSRARLGFMGQVFMGPLPNSELELIPSKVHMCMVSPGMFNWSPAQPSYSTAKLICNLTVLLWLRILSSTFKCEYCS